MIIILLIKSDAIQRKSYATHICNWVHESNQVMLMYYKTNDFQISICISFRTKLSALEFCVYDFLKPLILSLTFQPNLLK